ncbi:hypothetical protein NUU61_005017 [Penicillium alfredii]|uniref:Uncharacterized protein n=1 Tax=Penicillium alfredii TaxID=1506179 RepID=A0A9W9F8Q2_9EURO|nr:uncharacterized protein NUU61_005017 [Penicillium alfredii]KAJ5095661.1 hypothetical protein NUU61_005017 [Penicillium alfredii]
MVPNLKSFASLFLLLCICIQVLAIESLGLTRDKLDEENKGISYSSIIEFEEDTKSFENKTINGICKDAYDQMFEKANSDGIGKDKRPGVMTALAIGKRIYLASSIKKDKGYWYKYDDTWANAPQPLIDGLEECQREEGGQRHRTEASCGEPNTIGLFYDYNKDTADVTKEGGRITTWGRKPPGWDNIYRDPCTEENKWGCRKLTTHFNLEVVSKTDPEDVKKKFSVLANPRRKC